MAPQSFAMEAQHAISALVICALARQLTESTATNATSAPHPTNRLFRLRKARIRASILDGGGAGVKPNG
jgi:hypothetical protein